MKSSLESGWLYSLINYCRVMLEARWYASFQMHPRTSRWVSYPGALDVVQMMSLGSIRMWHDLGTGLAVYWRTWRCRKCEKESDAVMKIYLYLQWSLAAWQDYCSVQNKWHQVENKGYFIHSFIPLACPECDDSLPFSGASSIPPCYILFLQLFSANYSSILPHFILPSISWSTFQSFFFLTHV
jgi:hypothetical protein